MLMLIWLSLSGCAHVRVIPDSQVETFLKRNDTFTAPLDGVFMPLARYQRYRRAVADEILKLAPK